MASTQPQVFSDTANSFLIIRDSIKDKQPDINFDNMHKHIEGIVSHVIVYLLALGWNPTSIIEWHNPAGDKYIFSPGQAFPVMTLIFDILETYHALKAIDAQQHYHGASLNDTIAWHQSLTRNRYLKKQNRSSELALLETIQAAATWPIDRVHEIHQEVPNQCPLCQQEVDKWHSYWTCPCLQELEEEDISNSNYLIEKLQAALDSDQPVLESLWLRGLVTKAQITPKAEHNPLEEYPITIRHIDYTPPNQDPLEVQIQTPLNQFIREHLPTREELEHPEPTKTYHPPESDITKYFDYLNSLNNTQQEPQQALPLEDQLVFLSDTHDSQA